MLVNKIEMTTTIHAEAAQVWSVLIDFTSYPKWTTFIRLLQGRLEQGRKVVFYATLLNGFRMPFRAKIIEFNPGTFSLVWSGSFLHSYFFKGEHYFYIKQINEESLLIHGENYSGVLLRYFQWLINISKPSYEKFNLDLKDRVESLTTD